LEFLGARLERSIHYVVVRNALTFAAESATESHRSRSGGFAGTTTASIARKADVTEAQLFRYFGSKSNVFRETIFKPLEQTSASVRQRPHADFEKERAVRENTHLYTTELQRFISKHSQMLTSLVVAQTYDSGTGHGVGEINSLDTYFDRAASMMTKRIKASHGWTPN